MASKSKVLDVNVKNRIIQLRNESLTYRAIGIQLNISLFTVRCVVKKFNETGSTENKVRSGRPGIFSAREKRSINKEVKKNPKISAPQLAKDVANTSHKTFSVQTIRNVLYEESYYGRAARKKPFISERNRRKRLDFAKSRVNLSDEFWNTVIFSDESKFNIFWSDGRQHVWRKPNTELEKQHLTPTVKYGGGSVLVWSCMAANGVGKLCFTDGTSFVFQQDNDPKHTANLTREWLMYNFPRQFKTPPQSPDINPIENLWHKLDVEVIANTFLPTVSAHIAEKFCDPAFVDQKTARDTFVAQLRRYHLHGCTFRSNSWDAQLAVPNVPRYARLETNLEIRQAKER
ncbi:transposable element Tc1 transposase [Trichonephila clavipes]|nr:transposable element Tc1 transposase [Trichonephila clavipes]